MIFSHLLFIPNKFELFFTSERFSIEWLICVILYMQIVIDKTVYAEPKHTCTNSTPMVWCTVRIKKIVILSGKKI